jgi:hypothetical protein
MRSANPTFKAVFLILVGAAFGGLLGGFIVYRKLPKIGKGSSGPAREQVAPADAAPQRSLPPAGGPSVPITPAPEPQPPAPGPETSAGPSFETLMSRVFAGEASDDEQLEFWEQVRKTDQIDGIISDLQTQVEADPDDVTGRMALAQLYVFKLLSAPDGPERGLLAGKAEAVWGEVLELDPDSFEAQYSIAFSYSQYPDFLNKTGEAVEAYENAIAIEGRIGPSEETAAAYIDLARLHRKTGDPASALEVLERGATAHPDHAAIREQLDKLKRGFVFEGQE